ncbi:MAG: DEAD/DEAH box helicase family protein [Candidatus Omnitrophota bacterium]
MNNGEMKEGAPAETIEVLKDRLRKLDIEKERLIFELNNLQGKSEPSNSVGIRSYSIGIKEGDDTAFIPDCNLKLFRSLFRGRDDVYARLWISKTTQRKGYSPVCKNEWVKGLCQKPAVKCTDCVNREFNPLTDEVIGKHLFGKQIIGIYPMLLDGTCYFLAIDFDGKGWVDNVSAFRKTCEERDIPVTIERSSSGNGAHAWFFFDEAIPAKTAREMGSFLLTETMSRHYRLGMESYDRLFPNQDSLPKGGLGNLIALPFQKAAVVRGNTLFIDERCEPYPDQWDFLSKATKTPSIQVEKLVAEAKATGRIIGVKVDFEDETEKQQPWLKLPSGKMRGEPVIGNLPDSLEVVFADKLYMRTDALPSPFLNQVKRLAAFQNPEFYKRQNMRLSTSFVPRVICCAELLENYLTLPRGCFESLLSLAKKHGITINIKDERTTGKKVNFKFYGKLEEKQKETVSEMLKNDIGVLVAPSGSGKTVLAINLITERKRNALVLVHRKPLVEQWRMQLASFLSLDLNEIGQIGGGKDKANGILDVAMIQSLQRKGTVTDEIENYGFIIVDECHHIPAVSFERALGKTKAKYILGLTATPYRKDGHQPIIHMQCGPIRHKMSFGDAEEQVFQYNVVVRKTGFVCEWSKDDSIHKLWPPLINNTERNERIVHDIMEVIQERRFPLILTERREHLSILSGMLQNKIEHLIILHGGIKPTERKKLLEELSNCPFDKSKAILATGTYLGEGFDDPRLDTLFLTMPISFKGRLIQYAGRLHRKHPQKKDVRIYDYVDEEVSVLWSMFQKRLKTYKLLGYNINTNEEIQALL